MLSLSSAFETCSCEDVCGEKQNIRWPSNSYKPQSCVHVCVFEHTCTHTHTRTLWHVCVRILDNCSQLPHKVSSIISVYTHGEREASDKEELPKFTEAVRVHLTSTSDWKSMIPHTGMSQLREEHLPGTWSVVASSLGALHIPRAHQPITDQVSPSSIHGGLSGL